MTHAPQFIPFPLPPFVRGPCPKCLGIMKPTLWMVPRPKDSRDAVLSVDQWIEWECTECKHTRLTATADAEVASR